MIRTHLENKAEADRSPPCRSARPRPGRAGSCGSTPPAGSIDFEEKPKTAEKLDRVRTDPDWIARLGIEAKGRPYLASMGIYLFNRATLVRLLASGNATDFGKEIFPQAIADHRVQAHLFDGYWEDIGTVGAFHKANIDLTLRQPAVRLHLRRPPDLHPAALPALLAALGRDGQQQPDRRRLRDRQGAR